MIKFSKRTKYAVKCLIHLRAYRDRGVISVQNISQTQKIPEKFLSAILSLLKNNGWVKSKQGPRGGYYLDENTEKITLKEIIEELEVKTIDQEPGPNDRLAKHGLESQACERVIAKTLDEVDEIISQHLTHLTLNEISKRYLKLIDYEKEMYTI